MLEIFEVDFNNQEHSKALVDLMNHYMLDEMGNHQPYDADSAKRLISGLKNHCNKLCLLARKNNEYIGLSNCFINFGTFAAKPFISIHDVVVKDTHRGEGVGRKLLESICRKAIEIHCCKITLEVRNDNSGAKHLYDNMGYKEGEPHMHFWTKYL